MLSHFCWMHYHSIEINSETQRALKMIAKLYFVVHGRPKERIQWSKKLSPKSKRE